MANEFQAVNYEHFQHVQTERYAWQCTNPYVSYREDRLLDLVSRFIDADDKFLEVGCGEGANLTRLVRWSSTFYGLDYSFPKLEFCRDVHSEIKCVCGDANQLPFADDSFDLVLVRDVIHHVSIHETVVSELVRVCKPDGRIMMIEANARNPIIWMQGLALKEERGVHETNPGQLRNLVASSQTDITQIHFAYPMPIFLVLLHYRFGLPWLARFMLVRQLLDLVESIGAIVLPQDRWAYVILVGQKTNKAIT